MANPDRYPHVKSLALSALLVGATGLWSVQGFLVEPKEVAVHQDRSRVPAAVGEAGVNGDQPAVAVEGGLEVLDWNCRNPKEAARTQAPHLRLKSKACAKLDLTAFEVKNQSNGFTATLFPAGPGFTTDFIDLVEGENRLLVRLKNLRGEVLERHIRVLRSTPAPVAGSESVLDRRAE